jgi:DNA-binding CsgD family transcriptional regulator
MPRFAHEDGGDEVWVDSAPHEKKPVHRSSRAVDPKRVEAGRKLALLQLLKSGDYTKAELAEIFNISLPTLYRHVKAIQRLQALAEELTQKGLPRDYDDDDYDDYLDGKYDEQEFDEECEEE